jgi:hypothetical protein
MPLEAAVPRAASLAASIDAAGTADAFGGAGTAAIWANAAGPAAAYGGGSDSIWGHQSQELQAAEAAAAVDGLVLELEPGGEGNMQQHQWHQQQHQEQQVRD